MNPKYRRLFITVMIVLTLGLAPKLILMALEDNNVYFYTPNDLLENLVIRKIYKTNQVRGGS